MPLEGPIVEATRAVLPVTWDALLSDVERFGETLLERQVDLAMEEVYGEILAPEEQEDLPIRVVAYIGKRAARSLIEPGIDFWMNEPTQVTATGVNEQHAYTNRVNALVELAKRLDNDLRRDEPKILALLGRGVIRNFPLMGISTPEDDVLLTPSPREFPAPFKQGTGNQRLT